MTRQNWFVTLALACVVFALTLTSVAPARAETPTTRPNIVFAFADDWGRYASVYGELEPGGPNDLVKTPNFDRIAREGVLFRNAFVNAPSCTPCRSSLLSGQYFFRTGRGAILQGAVWDSNIPTYPLLLKDAGYHIGHTYKVWSPGTPRDAPYGAQEFAYVKRGRKFNTFSQRASAAENFETGKNELLEEVRGNFSDFLAAGKGGSPSVIGSVPQNCHRKWTQGSGKELWRIDPDDLRGKLPGFLPDVPIVREDFADYLGEVQAFDAGLGVLIEELEKRGELDNTMIVVSGDHGIPGFPRGKCNLYDFGVAVPLAIRWGGSAAPGRVVEDFVCLPDLAPTFLEAGGVETPDSMTARSLLDVLKSDKGGLVDPSRDYVVVGRERHVARARNDLLPYPQRAIRTKDFLYIRNFKPERWPMGTAAGYGAAAGPMPDYESLASNTFAAFADLDASPTKAFVATHAGDDDMDAYFDFAFGRRPEEELYDLRNDPDQMKNVADDTNFADAKRGLSQRLMKVLGENNDPRVTADGTTFDKPPYTLDVQRSPRRRKPRS